MKAEVKIPKGWRRVRRGLSKDGDRFLQTAFLAWNMFWSECEVGNQISETDVFIRKVKKARKK